MKLTFFMFTDLRVGRGTENVLFNLLKYKPDNIDVTIVSTDDTGKNPVILSDSEVNELTRNCKIIKINRIKSSLKQNNKFMKIYNSIFFRPSIKTLKNVQKTTLKEIRDTDIVYLFANEFAPFFTNMGIPIIGSTHAFNLRELNNKPILNKFYFGFVYNIYYKNINTFHIFNNNRGFLKTLFFGKFLLDCISPTQINTPFSIMDWYMKNIIFQVIRNPQ